jgi:hypothetical protein
VTEGMLPVCSSPDIIRVMKSSEMKRPERVAFKQKMRNMYRILSDRGKKPLGRPK